MDPREPISASKTCENVDYVNEAPHLLCTSKKPSFSGSFFGLDTDTRPGPISFQKTLCPGEFFTRLEWCGNARTAGAGAGAGAEVWIGIADAGIGAGAGAEVLITGDMIPY